MKAQQPTIAIVTPVFNKIAHTRQFLLSIQRQSYKYLRVYIVDDASSDNTSEILAREFPDVHVTRSETGNLWWAGGTNLGITQAISDKSDYVLTINNDVEVSSNYISNLMQTALENPQTLIGSMVCDKDAPDRVWFMGGYMNTSTGRMAHYTGSIHEYPEIQSAEWLTGMGMLIPAKVFEEIGLFNAKIYPQYNGDADFSLRAKKAGYKLIVDPHSVIYADVQSSWVATWLKNPRVSFLYNLYFSKRSPFQLNKTVRFYRDNWRVSNYVFALLKLYTVGLKETYNGYIRSYAKKVLQTMRILPS